MDTPHKKQPRKHFFKFPPNYSNMTAEEQKKWAMSVAIVLHWEEEHGVSAENRQKETGLKSTS